MIVSYGLHTPKKLKAGFNNSNDSRLFMENELKDAYYNYRKSKLREQTNRGDEVMAS